MLLIDDVDFELNRSLYGNVGYYNPYSLVFMDIDNTRVFQGKELAKVNIQHESVQV